MQSNQWCIFKRVVCAMRHRKRWCTLWLILLVKVEWIYVTKWSSSSKSNAVKNKYSSQKLKSRGKQKEFVVNRTSWWTSSHTTTKDCEHCIAKSRAANIKVEKMILSAKKIQQTIIPRFWQRGNTIFPLPECFIIRPYLLSWFVVLCHEKKITMRWPTRNHYVQLEKFSLEVRLMLTFSLFPPRESHPFFLFLCFACITDNFTATSQNPPFYILLYINV